MHLLKLRLHLDDEEHNIYCEFPGVENDPRDGWRRINVPPNAMWKMSSLVESINAHFNLLNIPITATHTDLPLDSDPDNFPVDEFPMDITKPYKYFVRNLRDVGTFELKVFYGERELSILTSDLLNLPRDLFTCRAGPFGPIFFVDGELSGPALPLVLIVNIYDPDSPTDIIYSLDSSDPDSPEASSLELPENYRCEIILEVEHDPQPIDQGQYPYKYPDGIQPFGLTLTPSGSASVAEASIEILDGFGALTTVPYDDTEPFRTDFEPNFQFKFMPVEYSPVLSVLRFEGNSGVIRLVRSTPTYEPTLILPMDNYDPSYPDDDVYLFNSILTYTWVTDLTTDTTTVTDEVIPFNI